MRSLMSVRAVVVFFALEFCLIAVATMLRDQPWEIFLGMSALLLACVFLIDHRRRLIGVFNLDPSHLIVTGVAGVFIFALIALTGLAWQHFQSTASEMAAIQLPPSEVEDKKTWPKTPAYDVPRKLELIDQLLEIFGADNEYEITYREGKALTREWEKEIGGNGREEFLGKLQSFGERLKSLYSNISDIRKKSEVYEDIKNIATQKGPQNIGGALNKLTTAIMNLRPMPDRFGFFIKPYVEEFDHALQEFGKLRFETEKALLARRQEIAS